VPPCVSLLGDKYTRLDMVPPRGEAMDLPSERLNEGSGDRRVSNFEQIVAEQSANCALTAWGLGVTTHRRQR
jgi:hypothetical protein